MDLETVASELGLERHEFLELLGIFLEAAREDLARLEPALSGGDLGTAAAAAHSLKGAALNLGLMAIADQARFLEQAAKSSNLTGVEGHLAILKNQLQDLGQLA